MPWAGTCIRVGRHFSRDAFYVVFTTVTESLWFISYVRDSSYWYLQAFFQVEMQGDGRAGMEAVWERRVSGKHWERSDIRRSCARNPVAVNWKSFRENRCRILLPERIQKQSLEAFTSLVSKNGIDIFNFYWCETKVKKRKSVKHNRSRETRRG